jgi:hypothetical protein
MTTSKQLCLLPERRNERTAALHLNYLRTLDRTGKETKVVRRAVMSLQSGTVMS